MPGQPHPLTLAGEFRVATAEQWRSLVSDVLRRSGLPEGRDPIRALTTTTYDQIDIAPLYTAAEVGAASVGAAGLPGQPPFTRGTTAGSGWDIRQRHADPDVTGINAAVLADLAGGATSLWLVLGPGGLSVADLPVAMDGVYFDLAPIALDAGTRTEAAAAAFLQLLTDRGGRADDVAGTLGADPIGLYARTGTPADLDLLGQLARQAAPYRHLRIATVDGTIYHGAGGSDADELGVATSIGVAYLRALTGSGIPMDEALAAVEFRFAVTDDQFLSIAKLRAGRRLWDRVGDLCGVSTRLGQQQHAVTSAAMMTRRDPWVNMLRTTVACFAAAIGGAQAITVLPFDAAIGLPDDFALRIARNTQSILHDESGLARVVDAAGGSWYVESLTETLADKAWAAFTAIERCGGALAALGDGTISASLARSRDQRADDIAHRRAPLTGVSEFALLDERPVIRRPAPAAEDGGPLPVIRYARDFEELRDRSDAAIPRPTVFLAGLGPAAAHSARMAFAANLFRVGGIEPVNGTGDVDQLVEAFLRAGSRLVCLCSSDRGYAEFAAAAATALKASGAGQVWLAGQPGDRRESDRDAGIDGYVFQGCDALAVLREALATSGVA